MTNKRLVYNDSLKYLCSFYFRRIYNVLDITLGGVIDFIIKIPLHLLVAIKVLVSKNDAKLSFEERFRNAQEQKIFNYSYKAATALHFIPTVLSILAITLSIMLPAAVIGFALPYIGPKQLIDQVIRNGINPNNIHLYCRHDSTNEDLDTLKNYLDNLTPYERLNLTKKARASSIYTAISNAIHDLTGSTCKTRPDILKILLSYPEIKASLLFYGNEVHKEYISYVEKEGNKRLVIMLKEMNIELNKTNSDIAEILDSCDPTSPIIGSVKPDATDALEVITIILFNPKFPIEDLYKQAQLSKQNTHNTKQTQLFILAQKLATQLSDDNTEDKDVDATITQINQCLNTERSDNIRKVNLMGFNGIFNNTLGLEIDPTTYQAAAAALVALGHEEAVNKLDQELHNTDLVKAAKKIHAKKDDKKEPNTPAVAPTPMKTSAVRHVLSISKQHLPQANVPAVNSEQSSTVLEKLTKWKRKFC